MKAEYRNKSEHIFQHGYGIPMKPNIKKTKLKKIQQVLLL